MGSGRARKTRSGCVSVALLAVALHQAAASAGSCQRVTLNGEVNAGQEWRASFGHGWVFRVIPIAPLTAGYSGWDLVVDRDPPAGFPDALLLATLPYNSINEREIGATFGLRAQDAIGWNPRSFRFLTDLRDFREAQSIFMSVFRSPIDPAAERQAEALARLLALQKGASSGELRILDARIVPGTADPMPYARAWALAGSRMQHEIESVSPGQESARGKLVWMRFALTVWLPPRWGVPPELSPMRAPCPR